MDDGGGTCAYFRYITQKPTFLFLEISILEVKFQINTTYDIV